MDASVVSRRVALDLLVSCLDKGQPLDDALARHQGFAGLDPRDRAFVRLLLAPTSSCSWAPRRTLPSIPRCAWWSMPAYRTSRALPTPCCAEFRAMGPRC